MLLYFLADKALLFQVSWCSAVKIMGNVWTAEISFGLNVCEIYYYRTKVSFVYCPSVLFSQGLDDLGVDLCFCLRASLLGWDLRVLMDHFV